MLKLYARMCRPLLQTGPNRGDGIFFSPRAYLTLCMLGNFASLSVVCSFLFVCFSKSTFSKNYLRNTFKVSNSSDPDQARRSVGPDLDPNFLQRLTADDTGRQVVKVLIYLVVKCQPSSILIQSYCLTIMK